MNVARFGWIRDLPDHRDRVWQGPAPASAALPRAVDLRPQCPPVYDQGNLGSCTANAIAGAVEFDEIRAGITPSWTPSRLFLYYNERLLEGTVGCDCGAQLRDGIKVIVRSGVCTETEWPYDPAKFAERPAQQAYDDALHDRITTYLRVPQSLSQLQACLAAGYPFVFGFTVFSSFDDPAVRTSGMIPHPQPTDSTVGGHAVACVGYDDVRQAFVIRNSWGDGWGASGYGFMPYSYVLDSGLASDFWTIRSAPAALRTRPTGSPSQRAEEG